MSEELTYSEVIDVIENYKMELEAIMDACKTSYCNQFVKAVQRHNACIRILELLKARIAINEIHRK